MKKAEVVVPWSDGLHMRPAARLVLMARRFSSSIRLKAHGKVADAGSIVGIMLLCASFGTTIEIEAVGEDEAVALGAVAQVFEAGPPALVPEVRIETGAEGAGNESTM